MDLGVVAVAADRRTGTIFEAMFTAAATMTKQHVPQGRPRPVQPHPERAEGNAEFKRDRVAAFVIQINAADQFALVWPHRRNQATDTFADVDKVFRPRFRGIGDFLLSFEGGTQPARTAVLAVMVIQGGAQDRVEPGIQLFRLTQLILAMHHPQAEFLQNVFGLGQIAKTFDEKSEKHLAVDRKRRDRGACGHVVLVRQGVTMVHSHHVNLFSLFLMQTTAFCLVDIVAICIVSCKLYSTVRASLSRRRDHRKLHLTDWSAAARAENLVGKVVAAGPDARANARHSFSNSTGAGFLSPVKIEYHSDILCIWAYVAQRRIEQLIRTFGERVEITAYFCSVFPDARGKIGRQWEGRGGFAGYSAHVRSVAEKFPHVAVHEDIWSKTIPRTSAAAHLFVKAVEIVEASSAEVGRGEAGQSPKPYLEKLSTRAAWALRTAFFADARDISDWDTHRDIATSLGIDQGLIDRAIRSSEALARLESDYNQGLAKDVKGSPTFLMNEGRQRLFGNVGYKLIEANVLEVLEGRHEGEASWC